MPGASDRVEALFAGPLPAIYNLLRAGEQDHIAIEVITHLDDRTVRGVALTPTQGVARGEAIRDTGHVLRVPVGNRVLGRIFNVFGETLDRREPVTGGEWRSIHQKPIALRQQSTAEEILETGKTAVALDTIINQRETGVVCVYCAVGQRNAAVARLIADLRKYGALANAVVVVALGEDPPGIQYHQSHLHHRRPDLSFARPVPAGVLPAIDGGRSRA